MKYKHNETEKEYLIKEEGVIKDLKDLDDLMKREGITYWLTSGTLLGAISRNSILPFDRDVDLGMWSSERNKLNKILPFLIEKGFSVKQRYDPAHNKIKGMVTIKRNKAPIDVKLYDVKGEYVVRGIHKCNSVVARVSWELIDILYFKKNYKTVIGSIRQIPLYPVYKLLSKMLLLVNDDSSKKIITNLAKIWRNSNASYGMEILPKKYPDHLVRAYFYGLQVNVFESSHEYLDEEYGEGWDQHNPNGKGGTEKYSHILLNEKTIVESRYDHELYNRCKAVGYIT
jgi:phosphorylcholine metabolism protein LicD